MVLVNIFWVVMNSVINLLLLSGKFLSKAATKTLQDALCASVKAKDYIAIEYEKVGNVIEPHDNMFELLQLRSDQLIQMFGTEADIHVALIDNDVKVTLDDYFKSINVPFIHLGQNELDPEKSNKVLMTLQQKDKTTKVNPSRRKQHMQSQLYSANVNKEELELLKTQVREKLKQLLQTNKNKAREVIKPEFYQINISKMLEDMIKSQKFVMEDLNSLIKCLSEIDNLRKYLQISKIENNTIHVSLKRQDNHTDEDNTVKSKGRKKGQKRSSDSCSDNHVSKKIKKSANANQEELQKVVTVLHKEKCSDVSKYKHEKRNTKAIAEYPSKNNINSDDKEQTKTNKANVVTSLKGNTNINNNNNDQTKSNKTNVVTSCKGNVNTNNVKFKTNKTNLVTSCKGYININTGDKDQTKINITKKVNSSFKNSKPNDLFETLLAWEKKHNKFKQAYLPLRSNNLLEIDERVCEPTKKGIIFHPHDSQKKDDVPGGTQQNANISKHKQNINTYHNKLLENKIKEAFIKQDNEIGRKFLAISSDAFEKLEAYLDRMTKLEKDVYHECQCMFLNRRHFRRLERKIKYQIIREKEFENQRQILLMNQKMFDDFEKDLTRKRIIKQIQIDIENTAHLISVNEGAFNQFQKKMLHSLINNALISFDEQHSIMKSLTECGRSDVTFTNEVAFEMVTDKLEMYESSESKKPNLNTAKSNLKEGDILLAKNTETENKSSTDEHKQKIDASNSNMIEVNQKAFEDFEKQLKSVKILDKNSKSSVTKYIDEINKLLHSPKNTKNDKRSLSTGKVISSKTIRKLKATPVSKSKSEISLNRGVPQKGSLHRLSGSKVSNKKQREEEIFLCRSKTTKTTKNDSTRIELEKKLSLHSSEQKHQKTKKSDSEPIKTMNNVTSNKSIDLTSTDVATKTYKIFENQYNILDMHRVQVDIISRQSRHKTKLEKLKNSENFKQQLLEKQNAKTMNENACVSKSAMTNKPNKLLRRSDLISKKPTPVTIDKNLESKLIRNDILLKKKEPVPRNKTDTNIILRKRNQTGYKTKEKKSQKSDKTNRSKSEASKSKIGSHPYCSNKNETKNYEPTESRMSVKSVTKRTKSEPTSPRTMNFSAQKRLNKNEKVERSQTVITAKTKQENMKSPNEADKLTKTQKTPEKNKIKTNDINRTKINQANKKDVPKATKYTPEESDHISSSLPNLESIYEGDKLTKTQTTPEKNKIKRNVTNRSKLNQVNKKDVPKTTPEESDRISSSLPNLESIYEKFEINNDSSPQSQEDIDDDITPEENCTFSPDLIEMMSEVTNPLKNYIECDTKNEDVGEDKREAQAEIDEELAYLDVALMDKKDMSFFIEKLASSQDNIKPEAKSKEDIIRNISELHQSRSEIISKKFDRKPWGTNVINQTPSHIRSLRNPNILPNKTIWNASPTTRVAAPPKQKPKQGEKKFRYETKELVMGNRVTRITYLVEE